MLLIPWEVNNQGPFHCSCFNEVTSNWRSSTDRRIRCQFVPNRRFRKHSCKHSSAVWCHSVSNKNALRPNNGDFHPWSLSSNLKISHWKRRFLLEIIILRFHVKLWGCPFLWLVALIFVGGYNVVQLILILKSVVSDILIIDATANIEISLNFHGCFLIWKCSI